METPRSRPERAGDILEGEESEHDRFEDEAARGQTSDEQQDFGDVDPDSADSDNSRDDTIDDL